MAATASRTTAPYAISSHGSDDFGAEPWLYPGTPVDRSDPIDPGDLEPDSGRTLVLAVGSNASRAVLRRKLERFGVAPEVSFIRATVCGLRVGHSAHISVPGYIPAAPVADPDAKCELVASLLDSDGLAAIDATEPNYRRHELSTERFPLELDLGGQTMRPATFQVYVSRRGVLAAPGEAPLSLTGQEELFGRLGECPGFAGLAEGTPSEVMRIFAGSAELRDAARNAFGDGGWIARSVWSTGSTALHSTDPEQHSGDDHHAGRQPVDSERPGPAPVVAEDDQHVGNRYQRLDEDQPG